MSDLDELYQSVIIDDDRRPRNFRPLEGENCREAEGFNPLCGDRFKVMVQVDQGVIKDASFQGAGCAISKASASLMTENLKGKTVAEANVLFERFHRHLTGRAGRRPAVQAARVRGCGGLSDAGEVCHAGVACDEEGAWR